MTWKKVVFSSLITDGPTPETFVSLVQQRYEEKDRPAGFVVFEQTAITPPAYYLMPQAVLYCADILITVSSSDCDAPSGDMALRLVVGVEGMAGPR